MKRMERRTGAVCPFWHELATDFACLFPQRAYCLPPGQGKPRFPGRATILGRCLADYQRCKGYRRPAP
jgi:hypothetical protein